MLSIAALAVLALLAAAAGWLYTPDRSRARLEATYHVAAGDYATMAGLRLHLRDTGPRDAPAVVLLHGFGDSLFTFDAWADRLSAAHRVIRYDLPGFGLTGVDPTGDYSEERGIAVLAGLLDYLEIARASIAGNSMGGRLAWRFAAAHPERVEKLVLISPDGFASKELQYGRAPDIPLMVRALPYVLPTALVRMSLAPAYGNQAAMTDAVVIRYRDLLLAPGARDAIIARMRQTVLVDPLPLLARIQAPTLLLWGERDGMIPFANSVDYLKAIPHCTMVALPTLGHVPQVEDPDQSLAPVLAFLDH